MKTFIVTAALISFVVCALVHCAFSYAPKSDNPSIETSVLSTGSF